MKALVTGATGFIGGHIVDRLIKDGHEVRCLARSPEKAKRLLDLGVEVVYGDVRNIESIANCAKGIDCVFHCAAKVADWGPWKDFEETTVRGTENVLKIAAKSSVLRFIFISTIGVYDKKYLQVDQIPITEKTPLNKGRNVDFYCRSKMLAEQIVYQFNMNEMIKATIIRPVTIYGPRDESIFTRMVEYIQSPYAFWVGKYNPVVGMLYIDDLVDLCILSVEKDLAVGKIYNAAPEKEVRIRDFFLATCKELELSYPKITIPYWLALLAAYLLDSYNSVIKNDKPPIFSKLELDFFTTLEQRCDNSLAKSEINWIPRVDLHDGMKKTAEWYKEFIKI